MAKIITTLRIGPTGKWLKLAEKIEQDYGWKAAKIPMIRKRQFGFVVRRYRYFDVKQSCYQIDIMLDFDTEQQLIIFQLRYL